MSNNQYTFSIKLLDLATGKMQDVASDSKSLAKAIDGLTKKNEKLGNEMKQLGDASEKLSGKLKKALDIKAALKPDDLRNLERMNSLIKDYANQLNIINQRQRSMLGGGGAAGGGRGGNRPPTGRGGGMEFLDGITNGLPFANVATNPYFLGGTALAGTIGFAASQTMSFDRAMGRVNMTGRLDPKQRQALADQIRAVAFQSGMDPTETAYAFERVLSNSGNVGKASEMFGAVMAGSRAMGTDPLEIAKAVAQVQQKMPNSSAASIVDKLVAAQQSGAGEGGDFARYLPNIITGASGAKMSGDGAIAAFSLMTRSLSADKSATMLENLYSNLARPDVAGKMDAGLGGIYDAKGNFLEIDVIAAKLQKRIAGMNSKELPQFLENIGLRDIQARTAFLSLAQDAGQLEDVLKKVKDSAGQAADAIDKSSSSSLRLEQSWNRLKTTISDSGFVKGATDRLASFLGGVTAFAGGKVNDREITDANAINVDYARSILKKAEAGNRILSDDAGLNAILNNFVSGRKINQTLGLGILDQLPGEQNLGYDNPSDEAVKELKNEIALYLQKTKGSGVNMTGIAPKTMQEVFSKGSMNTKLGSSAKAMFEETVKTSDFSAEQRGAEIGGITIHIDRLNGVENMNVGTTAQGAQAAGSNVLKELNKVIRDAEGMRGGGAR